MAGSESWLGWEQPMIKRAIAKRGRMRVEVIGWSLGAGVVDVAILNFPVDTLQEEALL